MKTEHVEEITSVAHMVCHLQDGNLFSIAYEMQSEFNSYQAGPQNDNSGTQLFCQGISLLSRQNMIVVYTWYLRPGCFCTQGCDDDVCV